MGGIGKANLLYIPGSGNTLLMAFKKWFLNPVPQEDVLSFLELPFPTASKYLQQYNEVNHCETEGVFSPTKRSWYLKSLSNSF